MHQREMVSKDERQREVCVSFPVVGWWRGQMRAGDSEIIYGR